MPESPKRDLPESIEMQGSEPRIKMSINQRLIGSSFYIQAEGVLTSGLVGFLFSLK